MSNESEDERRAVALTIRAKGIVRRAVEVRLNDADVWRRARELASWKIAEGAPDHEILTAVGMSFFESVKEDCSAR